MKKLAWLIVSVVVFAVDSVLAIPNPAALYAERLGYEFKIVETPAGQTGVVVVEPGVELDAWAFYRGKVGSKYAYGEIYGYDTISETKDMGSFTVEYAVCVSRGENGVRQGERITLEALMARNNEQLVDSDVWMRWPSEDAETGNLEESAQLEVRTSLPSSFDWRARNGAAYIGSVRSQGSCGSCYAFAAVAAAEGTYNYAMGLTGSSRVSFSESFIAWCLGRVSPYSTHFFGCRGADYEYMELEALCNIGICKAGVFPYSETDPGCAHMDAEKVTFSSWGRAACNDINAIKTAIMTYGVVDAAVLSDQSAFMNYSGGVYTDSLTSCNGSPCSHTSTDHAIALVGWNDADGGYWILRNSWGPNWGESGYMRISYQAARVACSVSYLTYQVPPTPPPPPPPSTGRSVLNDYTGDGRSEVVVYNTYSGDWHFLSTSRGYLGALNFGFHGAYPVPGDYDGDGIADLAVHHYATGDWYIWLMAGQFIHLPNFGGNGFWPTSGDYTGDGRDELIAYNLSNGDWHFVSLVNGYLGALNFGYAGAIPVPNDYVGDGKFDLVVYGYNTGDWYLSLSDGKFGHMPGFGGSVFVGGSGDYTGNGTKEVTVYDIRNGNWHFVGLTAGYLGALNFGYNGAYPVPGDYDGDGTSDLVVYDYNTGDWYIWLMAGHFGHLPTFGGPGFVPILR